MNTAQQEKYPRIKIFCPINYACLDSNGKIVRERMAIGIGISQKEIIMESTNIIPSEYVLLYHVDQKGKLVEIKGKIGSCKKSENGKYKTEIHFEGPREQNIYFVKKVVNA